MAGSTTTASSWWPPDVARGAGRALPSAPRRPRVGATASARPLGSAPWPSTRSTTGRGAGGAVDGLNHPGDLAAWQRWQRAAAPGSRRSAQAGAPEPPPPGRADLGASGHPRCWWRPRLVRPSNHDRAGVDRWRTSSPLRTLAARPHRDRCPVGRAGAADAHARGRASRRTAARSSAAVLSAGHYTAARRGGATPWPRSAAPPSWSSQHGALTPFAPPLPRAVPCSPGARRTRLLGVRAQRRHHHVVGSAAAVAGGRDGPRRARSTRPRAPTYLGQLHGAETRPPRPGRGRPRLLPRTGATYRPHPTERDRASPPAARGLGAQGIRSTQRHPAGRARTPVVSVFSTGVLEAAARGSRPGSTSPARPRGWRSSGSVTGCTVGRRPPPPPTDPTSSPPAPSPP